jgi:3-phosphoshikimate 1-carboxyvinyltransferase
VRAVVKPAKRLRGTVRVPGDKSISHRALILNAVAAGTARLENLAAGDDVAATAACLRQLGVRISPEGAVEGVGLRGLKPPHRPLDCANSGTTMRLLAGLLAGQRFESVLAGDESLSRRPMERVAEPLRRMGAAVAAGPPLRVRGGSLSGTTFEMATPSAQVKSALLLAGLQASGTTRVVEPVKTRDHTERMLAAMAAPIRVDGLAVEVRRADRLDPLSIHIPGDLSSAAFWIAAAAVHPDARIQLPDVGVNPTRAGILRLLPVARVNERGVGGEPVANLTAATIRGLRPFPWRDGLAAELIDELPVLAVVATQLNGVSRITGAGELRVKESDRVATVAAGLRAMGADLDVLEDGWEVRGPTRLRGAAVDSAGDHRVAMALGVAGLLADGVTEIDGAEAVSISYPGFWTDLETLCSGSE